MGFDNGRIVLNSDTGIYYSGQTIYGKLIFDQEKEKTFRGIYVKLKGFCYVHWRTSHTRTVNGKQETYHVDHTSREEYVNQKTYLIGSETGECTIPPGHYEYPFQLEIPVQCPSSFEGTHGHIRYEVKAVVDRAFKFDQEKKAVVRVIAPLDLNSEPDVKDPIQMQFDETYYCCCSSSGSVTAIIKLPYGGYIPGQTIPIEVACDNRSSVTIDSITITLTKCIRFHAQDTRSESQDVAQLQLGAVLANTNRSFTTELLVPYVDTPNVRNCRYIDIEYRLKVVLSPDGCHSDSSESREIVIGTIPIVGSNYPSSDQDQVDNQNVPVVNQPLASHYPGVKSPYPGGATPYPGANSYPNNTPYPGPTITPYPTNNPPYPSGNERPPYPPPYTDIPSGGTPNPSSPIPYPTSKNPSENTPYPGAPTVTPYPTANSPYLPTSAPYPTSPSPFPPASSTAPHSDSKTAPTGLKTGTFGFVVQAGDNKVTMPQLPRSAVPYPISPSPDPYAAASAPEPGTPDDEKK